MQNFPFFHIEKCPIPIVWLDTSIITNITKWKNNFTLQPLQEKRIVKLFNKLIQLIGNGKIICPMADQESEIWAHRDSWLKTMNSLSLGIRTKSELDIYNSQLTKSMKAYVDDENDIYISYLDIFSNNPIEQLQTAISKNFYVCINRDIIGGTSYQYNLKKELYEQVEEQRKINVKNKISFSEQLDKEYSSRIETLILQLKQSYVDLFLLDKNDTNSFFCVETLMSELYKWAEVSGKNDDINGLVNFHYSNYYKEMPITNLSCNICAYLMTKDSKIETGDSMDVKHISTVMPYTNLFITDRKMRNYLKQNKFDKMYNVKICYIGDEDEIYSFFESMEN